MFSLYIGDNVLFFRVLGKNVLKSFPGKLSQILLAIILHKILTATEVPECHKDKEKIFSKHLRVVATQFSQA